eukprot:ctg_178.g132
MKREPYYPLNAISAPVSVLMDCQGRRAATPTPVHRHRGVGAAASVLPAFPETTLRVRQETPNRLREVG